MKKIKIGDMLTLIIPPKESKKIISMLENKKIKFHVEAVYSDIEDIYIRIFENDNDLNVLNAIKG